LKGFVLILGAIAGLWLFSWLFIWHGRLYKVGRGSAGRGAIVAYFRWLSGGMWHGGQISNRGWFSRGDKAFTRSGKIPGRHHRPRAAVAAVRVGSNVGAVAALYWWAVDRTAATAVLAACAVLGAVLLAWRGWVRVRSFRHRRTWVAPLHASIHYKLQRPLTDRPDSYIRVLEDRSAGEIDLPFGVGSAPSFRREIEGDVTARLGLDAPVFDWRGVAGPKPKLAWKESPPSPDLVTLEMVRDPIETAREGVLIAGRGKGGQLVTVSIVKESPHLLINGPTNSGKSVVVRSLAAQFLFHGGFAVLMDHKELSHTWADSRDGTLPNIAYCRSDEQIHHMLLWLQREMRRRNAVARAGARRDGRIDANVGDRLLIVCEELNVMAARLAAYWRDYERQQGDPLRSPAVIALNELLFMGRQVKMHIIQAAQRAEANAVGGGAARENMVGRIMIGKCTPKTWKMLAGEFEMPPMKVKQGRAYMVTDSVHEVQTTWLTEQEAWDLALAGEVTVPPLGMPYVLQQPDAPGISPGEEPVTAGPVTPPRPMLSLREAVDEGVISKSLPAIRMWRNRYRARFPAPAGWDGPTELYWEDELKALDDELAGARR
jgi:hypothetical protein